MWVVELAEIQTDLFSAEALVMSTEQRIVPVKVINLTAHEKVICKNSDVGQCAPVELVINNESAKISVKDQKEFGENAEKRISSSREK